jgi:hypothetical protein
LASYYWFFSQIDLVFLVLLYFQKNHFSPSMEIYEILLTKRECHVTNKLCRKALVEEDAHSKCMLNSCILLRSNILMPPLFKGGNLYKVNKVLIMICNVHDIFKLFYDISFCSTFGKKKMKRIQWHKLFFNQMFFLDIQKWNLKFYNIFNLLNRGRWPKDSTFSWSSKN